MNEAARQHLEAIFRRGVEACLPERVMPPHLPEPPPGRTLLLAAGKAAVPMARVAERRWQGPLSGVAVTRDDPAEPLERIEILAAGHPVPDEASLEAAERLLTLAKSAGPDDLVLALLSGGASALACLPGEGLSLEEKRRVTEALLRSGASIREINCVRRHLSRIKGGRLAEAARPARLVTLAISDVVGDSPADIGSGPTVADPTTVEEAHAVLRRYGIEAPRAGWSESVKQVDGDYRIIAGGRQAMEAAAAKAAALGYVPHILGECIGEARDVAEAHARIAATAEKGSALISGGEVTVTVRGDGRGGPNQEYALALALKLKGKHFAALAADTDGIDGSGKAAGAFVDSTTPARGPDAARALGENDSGGFFERLGDLFVTGPTGTNVNDLRVILIES